MLLKSERSGYVCIDHRESPGLPDGVYPPGMPIGPGKRFEGITNKCSHCQRQVIINPRRIRDRGYCYNCDRFLCDECAVVYKVTGKCNSFDRWADEYLERAARGEV